MQPMAADKTYNNILRSAAHHYTPDTAYVETEQGSWASDNYRLYIDGPPEQMPDKYQRVIPTGRTSAPLTLDKPLLSFLRVIAKGKTPRILHLSGCYEARGHRYNDELVTARLLRKPPISLPPEVGVNSAYFLDALKYITRGTLKGTVHLSAGDTTTTPLTLDCDDRHVVLMPTRLST